MRLQKSSLCNQLLPNDFCCQLANSWSTTMQCNGMCSMCQSLLDFWSPVVVQKPCENLQPSPSLFLSPTIGYALLLFTCWQSCVCVYVCSLKHVIIPLEKIRFHLCQNQCLGESERQTSDNRLTRVQEGTWGKYLGVGNGAVKMRKRRK